VFTPSLYDALSIRPTGGLFYLSKKQVSAFVVQLPGNANALEIIEQIDTCSATEIRGAEQLQVAWQVKVCDYYEKPLLIRQESCRMDHLEHPSLSQWEARRPGLKSISTTTRNWAHIWSANRFAPIAEVECCFWAGAWAAVIIVAFAVVDANLQETSGAPKNRKAFKFIEEHPFRALVWIG
jgi:hypothetical protein